MIMRNRSCKNVQFLSFMLDNDTLTEAESVKYLGHIISNSMLDDNDISRQCRQLYAQGNMIIRTFHMCSNDVKKTLFTTFFSPTYTAHLRWNFHNYDIRKLYVSYNNIFQMVFGFDRYCSASEMFVYNNLPNCAAVIRNFT